jgi:The GLUG motif.
MSNKSLICSFLCLSLIILFSLPCVTAQQIGNGTLEEPYQIQNIEDLIQVRNNLSANYILMNDLDGVELPDWTPIGNINSFGGTFNGNNKTISNISISSNDYKIIPLGLFGSVDENGRITNLVTSNITIRIEGKQDGKYAGPIAGYNLGYIENCHSRNVTIELENGKVGGIAGVNYGRITVCSSAGDLKASEVGGIVGSNIEGMISNSYSNATITNSERAGGIAGTNFKGNIQNCYSDNVLNSSKISGGIVGANYDNGKIQYCYSLSSILGNTLIAGGITGTNQGYIEDCISLNKCINRAKYLNISNFPHLIELNRGASIGFISGKTDYDKIPLNCYYSNQIVTNKFCHHEENGYPLSNEAIADTFPHFAWEGWDNQIWMLSHTSNIPILIWQNNTNKPIM